MTRRRVLPEPTNRRGWMEPDAALEHRPPLALRIAAALLRGLRRLLWALLLSLLFGFALGTVLRLRLERPVTYIGSARIGSPALHALPLDVGDAGAAVGLARQHEEQVG